jgi:DNA-binding CsgD family transcriptional regulator
MSDISNVIALIYDSAIDDEVWPDALKAVARFLQVKDVAVGTFDADKNFHETLNLPIDPDFTRSYFEYWAARNFLWQASASLPVGQLFSFGVAGPRDEFYRSALYNEWFRPQGMDIALGANLIMEGARSTVLTIYRPASRPEFGAREITRFRALLPHLQRAVQLRDQMPNGTHRAADVQALMDVLDKPAILVDRSANILFSNGLAEPLFRDGELIATPHGPLAIRRPEETAALRALVRSAALQESVNAGGKLIASRDSKPPLTLLVAPLVGARFNGNDQLAIVFVDDPVRRAIHPPDLNLLRAQFELTKSEAALAAALLSGLPLKAAAAQSGASFATARKHLVHVFQKTGVHSQPELVNLLRKAGYDG